MTERSDEKKPERATLTSDMRFVRGVDAILCLAVGAKVREKHVVVVVVEERAEDRLEEAGLEEREDVRLDHVERSLYLGVLRVPVLRDVRRTELRDVLCPEAEEEHVLVANLAVDLDVRAVVGPERQGAIHHELHVARSRRLHAREGDLLGDLGGRHDLLGERDAVVGKERDRELAARLRVGVDDAGDAVDEADDELRHVVPGGRLRREDELARHGIVLRVVEETVVEHHDVDREHELALVLVEALHLDVEDGVWVQIDAEVLLRPVGELALVAALDLRHRREEVLSCESEGFALRSQRRGVMPFVTLWNFSGQSS